MEARLVVNGQRRDLGDVGGHVTLLEWLRSAGLTGTKEGCAEGECGACAVLVARPDGDGTRWTAVNACLLPAAGLAGQEVITAEGLGSADDLHPVQRELAGRGGSQCGYCTPGFVCSMAAEYYRPDRRPVTAGQNGHQPPADGHQPADQPAAHDAEHGPNGFDLHALSGNLCRCTGYRPIRDAAYALGQPDPDDPLLARLRRPAPASPAIRLTGRHGSYARPADLAEALELLAEQPAAQLVAGSTDFGVELNLRHARPALTIGIDRIAELRELSVSDGWISIGAAVTLSEIEQAVGDAVPLLAELLPQFGSRLIRNSATLGGNLGTASPIGDAAPALLALDASLVLASRDGERTVALADYFTGYRQSVRRPDELIKTIRIPTPVAPISAFHKIAKRRFDDISSVAVAYALRLDRGTVAEARIGLGGVAATPLRARDAEAALIGRQWSPATVQAAAATLAQAGTPLSDHRASAEYRIAMLRESLLKLHAEHPGKEVHE
ncbi:MAG TPA: FAD binding domain-containing protein [Jatrophihabitans sp.]|nr:FAD binding domain-containing protein [Jatrophihabitans sp.]